MTYRTRTYIAAEWDGDSDAVQQLHKWNDSNHFSLSFTDAHDLQQSRAVSYTHLAIVEKKTMGRFGNGYYYWKE